VDRRLLLQVGLLGALAVLLFVFWNRRLAREVRLRTVAERSTTESRARLEANYEALQALERQKENLTHMIVHDMRNPLMVITGSLDVAAACLRDGRVQPGESREAIAMAQRSVDELNHIVDALLDVSRLEAGRMPVNPVPGSLRRAAEDAVQGQASVAAKRNIAVAILGDPGDCVFDRDLIRRVLANLVSNAIKACSGGDRVTVSIRDEASMVRTEVRDTGCGIDERYHVTIFEKFAQAGDSRVGRRTASSGVGLAFCKLVVENHGGRIGVRSRPGDGSTFWFELPRR